MNTSKHRDSPRWDSHPGNLPEILGQDDVEAATRKLCAIAKSVLAAQKPLACLRMERFFAEFPWAIAVFDVEHSEAMGNMATSRLSCYVSAKASPKDTVPFSAMGMGDELASSLRAIGDFRYELKGQAFDSPESFSLALLGEQQYRLWQAQRERTLIGRATANDSTHNAQRPRV